MFPEYFSTSGFDTPLVNGCPRLYVLLFIVVVIPVKLVSIPRVTDPPRILTDPPDAGDAVNLFKVNPYVGVLFCDPSVLNPTRLLSCQYFKTPVF
jgi:hypothetical protein